MIASRLTFLSRTLLMAGFTLALASCAPTPVDEGAYTREETGIQSAREALARAENARSPERDQHLIEAAEKFREAGRLDDARQALERVNIRLLAIPLRARYTLTYSELALDQDRFFLARELLTDETLAARRGQMTEDQRRRWHRLRGDLFSLLGEEARSVKEYVALTELLDDRQALLAVHDQIWRTLSHMPRASLGKAADTTTDATLEGWYRLALLSRQSQGNIDRQVQRIAGWRSDNPRHPAARIPPTSLQRAAAASTAAPDSLALLLPHHGDYSAAGNTLRDGFLSAYYRIMDNGGKLPAIHIYDTTATDTPVALYNRAVAEGADMVVGPLRKENLEALMAEPALPVPVLGLNYLEGASNPHANLYQFGLSTADEVRQVVHRAWLEGHRSALVIYPDQPWGQSARDNFADAWRDRDGTLVSAPPYGENQADFSPLLRPVLLLDQSEERARRLERTLGKNLEFVPRRRQDIDMIFLLARPQHGRQVKPTLDFLYAGDLPVYATSHIYRGQADPGQDRDLEGILFTAMPWTVPALEDRALDAGDGLAPAYRNLFAMGADAYKMHQWLALMQALPDVELQGHTGNLTMGPANRLRRILPWAVFHNGRVKPAPAVTVDEP